MGIVGGLDVHRAQITFDWVGDDEVVHRGQVRPATRDTFRAWLEGLGWGDGDFAVEATTGWRYIVEELQRAGFRAHLAEPADTAAARGRKRRAKTDREDALHLRRLLQQGRLPESWIAPAYILDLREVTRLRHTLADQRSEWHQRLHAVLYHHGVARPQGSLMTAANREWLMTVPLPATARHTLGIGVSQIDQLDAALRPIDRWIGAYGRLQAGCRALRANHFGVGAITSVTIYAEVGDARRFRNGDAIVRYTGLDVTVYSSDGKRSPGHLAKQGPPALRWALFEAATCAARPASPDYDYYQQVKHDSGGKRPTLSVARKLIRRARHTLIEVGDDAIAPVDPALLPPLEVIPAAAVA